jgi:hypothetical protein
VAKTLDSLDQLMALLQRSLPDSRIIVISPNPAVKPNANAQKLMYSDYLNQTKEHILAKGWEFVDVYADMERQRQAANLPLEKILLDGVHPNSVGYGYWFETMKTYFTTGKSGL